MYICACSKMELVMVGSAAGALFIMEYNYSTELESLTSFQQKSAQFKHWRVFVYTSLRLKLMDVTDTHAYTDTTEYCNPCTCMC